jgi:major membrane immunogen (membrane-anchored lipoprotein)
MKKLLLFLILAIAILTTACSNSEKSKGTDNTSDIVYDDKVEQKVYNEVTEVFNAIKEYDEAKIKKQFKEGYFTDFIDDQEALKLLLSKMEYNIKSIEINDAKDKAFVEISVKGVDTAKIIYEMLMFNYGFSGIAGNNKKLEKEMNDLAVNIVNRNINNSMESTINITVNKEGFNWKVVNDVIIRDSIIGSSISNEGIYAKVSENIISERISIADLYKVERPNMSLEEYTIKKMTEFCENYLSEHINDYPFSEAFSEI